MKTDGLIKRYTKLCETIDPKGWICMGSAIERSYARKAAGGEKMFGPYYSWTRKVDNKTVTTALTQEQFEQIRQAIKRHKQLDKMLAQMRDTSVKYILNATPCVARRSKNSNP